MLDTMESLRRPAWPLLLLPNPELRALSVLSCYLDESGEDGESIITLAGWVATEDLWRKFEEHAGYFFDQVGLEHLHTVDLHLRRGFFKDFTREQCADFANAFLMLLSKYDAYGFEFSVLKSQYNQRKKEFGVSKSISPLGFCMVGIINLMLENEAIKEITEDPDASLSIVLEGGHKNAQDCVERFLGIKKKTKTKRLGGIQLMDKTSTIALQAADFLAYFSRRLRNKDKSHPRYDDEMRFFKAATKGVPIYHFLATDFGV